FQVGVIARRRQFDQLDQRVSDTTHGRNDYGQPFAGVLPRANNTDDVQVTLAAGDAGAAKLMNNPLHRKSTTLRVLNKRSIITRDAVPVFLKGANISSLPHR